jgi:sulfite oxidase
VQWLKKIAVSRDESTAFWQRSDYKLLGPAVTWDGMEAAMKATPAMQDMPVTSAIAAPKNGSSVADWQDDIDVKGFAWSGGGRAVVRVDVSADGGKTWHESTLQPAEDAPGAGVNRHWAWTLWTATVPVPVDPVTGKKVRCGCGTPWSTHAHASADPAEHCGCSTLCCRRCAGHVRAARVQGHRLVG